MKEFVNLTPHSINEVNTGITYPPSGNVARVETVTAFAGNIEGVPTYTTTFTDVEGLPNPNKGVYYIVSALVRVAVPNRKDVVSPGELLRDPDGRPVGCNGFIRN